MLPAPDRRVHACARARASTSRTPSCGSSPLTTKDLDDLDTVAGIADIVGYSFVQRASDIALLQRELEARTRRVPALVAKIETGLAVRSLPEIIVEGAGRQPLGVMIARGDLAVEIGYPRLAELQEEMLWLCEAAHRPVIWATQVLDSFLHKGAHSRAEMTDAAMAERAECVMLNKGPYLGRGRLRARRRARADGRPSVEEDLPAESVAGLVAVRRHAVSSSDSRSS